MSTCYYSSQESKLCAATALSLGQKICLKQLTYRDFPFSLSIILAVDRRSIACPHENCQWQIAFLSLWFCVIDICGNRKRKSTAFQKYISRREADCFYLLTPPKLLFCSRIPLTSSVVPASWLQASYETHPLAQENKLYISHYVELYFGVVL